MVPNHPDAGGNHYLASYTNKRIMVANHPDAGGNHYLASYINKAKDVMLGKTKNSGSAL
ncbi:putative Chaperone J-domain superfamily [Helianthus anomalus]